MTEDTLWKVLSAAGIVIGFLAGIFIDAFKKNNNNNNKVYVCPLDKSGIDSKMSNISSDIDKQENKLNTIISTTEFNKKFIESLHEYQNKMSEALSKLVVLSEQQNKLLETILKNNK